ncbi:MAG: adenosylmethionine decarboxylase [Candidatus Caenarcaniphilales bacterium]|nr:adenosylmethionine decarboxylase [Candidatus Caenarcaniphilales bacterium]
MHSSYSSLSSLERGSISTSPFGTVGRHVIADLTHCNSNLIADLDFVKKILEEAVVKAKATIISSRFHRFSPTGVSGIILLSESHCSIHTWPDEGYAAIDIYTCGEHVFPQVACDHIAGQLQAKKVCLTTLERGLRVPYDSAYIHEVQQATTILQAAE